MWTMSLRIVRLLVSVILIICRLEKMDGAVLNKDKTVVVFKNSETTTLKYFEDNSTFFNTETTLKKVHSGVENNEYVNSYVEEGRKKTNKKQKEQGFMQKILPMMVIPFMVSTSMIPMMLISLKFMLLKSALIGKIAILLLIINMFRRRDNGGGVFTHNLNAGNDVAMDHYGYHGDEEYGAYINRRRKRNFS